jgi:hypothetical protein
MYLGILRSLVGMNTTSISPGESDELFPNGQRGRIPPSRIPLTPIALDPEIKSAAEAQRAAALQYSDPLARMVGVLSAKVFMNQFQQEELISILSAAPGDGPESVNRNRELENAHRGRREFSRLVQLAAQLRSVDRTEKSPARSSTRPRGEIPMM